GNGGSGWGNTIIADIERADWERIKNVIDESNLGIQALKIKECIEQEIASCKKQADWERKQIFLTD
ncbi:MAG TPA: hypothetical protein V6C96_00635, partial [Vampirovibrionales bacterium]